MQRLFFRFTHQYGTRPLRYEMASPAHKYSDYLYANCKKSGANCNCSHNEYPDDHKYPSEMYKKYHKKSGYNCPNDHFYNVDVYPDDHKYPSEMYKKYYKRNGYNFPNDHFYPGHEYAHRVFYSNYGPTCSRDESPAKYSDDKKSGAKCYDDLYWSKKKNLEFDKKLGSCQPPSHTHTDTGKRK